MKVFTDSTRSLGFMILSEGNVHGVDGASRGLYPYSRRVVVTLEPKALCHLDAHLELPFNKSIDSDFDKEKSII